MENKDLTRFSLSIYGDITAQNEVLSKARCRIFYKYGNRNGTYITDDFAEKLISTLPYVPVKGIYDNMEEDYTDHGHERYEGRIYGIVPENPNFAWEKHLDEDGVEREYACADVYLFTGIYKKEALDVISKSQSMELYADSIKGDWKFIDGKRYYVFTDGCFLGLQALGEKYEPCFEGAAFYTLVSSIEKVMSQIEQFELQSKEKVGGQTMEFKLSDNQKFNMIWTLLNTRFTEEDGYIMDYSICEVYDDYALAYSYANEGYERVYYTKNDQTDSLEITSKETAYVIDVTENEKKALEALHAMNGDTYDKVDEVVTELHTKIDTLTQNVEDFSQKNEEQATQISTLEQEKADIQANLDEVNESYTAAQEQIQSLTEENEELNNYQHEVMTSQKEELIDSYNDMLNEEVLNTYREKIDEWSYESLEKELAFTLVQSKPEVFSRGEGGPIHMPKDEDDKCGIEAILDRYK